jgi:hypothetical protein
VGNGVDYVKRLLLPIPIDLVPSLLLVLSLVQLPVRVVSGVPCQQIATMAIPKKALLLSSAAITFFSFRYAPQVALFPRSYFWNIASLFLIQQCAQLGWSIIVYPLFLSPLRHLPQPSVRFASEEQRIRKC